MIHHEFHSTIIEKVHTKLNLFVPELELQEDRS